MPAIDTEAQFKFLLCCIKHSAAGKVSRSLLPILPGTSCRSPCFAGLVLTIACAIAH